MDRLPDPPRSPFAGLRSWFRKTAAPTSASLADGGTIVLKPIADATGTCRWVGSATLHVRCGNRWVGAVVRVTATAVDSGKWSEETGEPPLAIPPAR